MSATPGPRLEMHGISKYYPGVQALDHVSLTIDEGEILALVGENGAGKSTLIKVLSGAIKPDQGEIRVDGERVEIASPLDSERLGIGTVYQELNLFPELSVAENLLFGRYPKRRGAIDWAGAQAEASRFLNTLGVEIDPQAPVAELSIAERQMLEIAKALHRKVRILILDEPTAVLGGSDVTRLLDMVRSLREHGMATIFISHRLEEIFGFADSYVVLKDGKPNGSGRVSDTDPESLVSMMVGRDLARGREARSERQPGAKLLSVSGLKREGVLDDISFDLYEAEVLGIAGLRGAGRTELARAIFGADPIDAGRIAVRDRPLPSHSPAGAIAAGIGLVPEDRKAQGLFLNLSTAKNIPVVSLAAGETRWTKPAGERELALEYRQRLGIRVFDVDAAVGTLSGGNQQKVVLSKWLEAGVEVLILDEPTRGIDVGSKQEIYALIRDLTAQGIGVILISSELPEILEMSDRILVMSQGALAAELTREEATEELIMSHAVGSSQAFAERGDLDRLGEEVAALEEEKR